MREHGLRMFVRAFRGHDASMTVTRKRYPVRPDATNCRHCERESAGLKISWRTPALLKRNLSVGAQTNGTCDERPVLARLDGKLTAECAFTGSSANVRSNIYCQYPMRRHRVHHPRGDSPLSEICRSDIQPCVPGIEHIDAALQRGAIGERGGEVGKEAITARRVRGRDANPRACGLARRPTEVPCHLSHERAGAVKNDAKGSAGPRSESRIK